MLSAKQHVRECMEPIVLRVIHLLEGLVFGKRAAESILHNASKSCVHKFDISTTALEVEGDKEKKDALRRIMWDKVSIVRTTSGLNEALLAIEKMLSSDVGRLLKLRLLSARAIVQAALKRTESIGVHYIA